MVFRLPRAYSLVTIASSARPVVHPVLRRWHSRSSVARHERHGRRSETSDEHRRAGQAGARHLFGTETQRIRRHPRPRGDRRGARRDQRASGGSGAAAQGGQRRLRGHCPDDGPGPRHRRHPQGAVDGRGQGRAPVGRGAGRHRLRRHRQGAGEGARHRRGRLRHRLRRQRGLRRSWWRDPGDGGRGPRCAGADPRAGGVGRGHHGERHPGHRRRHHQADRRAAGRGQRRGEDQRAAVPVVQGDHGGEEEAGLHDRRSATPVSTRARSAWPTRSRW